MCAKRVCFTPGEAVADIRDGASVMVGGFGAPGAPQALVGALVRKAPKNLTIVAVSAHGARPEVGEASRLAEAGLVLRIITSFPAAPRSELWSVVEDMVQQGRIQVETVPMGTLAERIRAGGAGLGGFWTRTGVGTVFGEGKEQRRFPDGRMYVLELPLRADFALIRAKRADTHGNLIYEKTQRNFNPAMAIAAETTIAEVDEVVESGMIDPEVIVTPGIFVDRLMPAKLPGA